LVFFFVVVFLFLVDVVLILLFLLVIVLFVTLSTLTPVEKLNFTLLLAYETNVPK
jgi:hypothetical protein